MASPFATGAFGLASATSWGGGDFCGGLATKRAPVFTVAAVSKLASLGAMLFLAWLRAEQIPSLHVLVWAGAAGVGGAVGLMALYQALAVGVMGVAAPVSAVIAATMPVVFAAFSEGPPSGMQFAGFGLALVAVWFISRPPAHALARGERRPRGLRLAVLAGIGFGGFYILISQARGTAVFWPLAASQFITLITVLAVVGAITIAQRRSIFELPAGVVPMMLLAGLLDAGGNAFFLLAEHAGRLDVAAVLASLYPASTVLLARVLLSERVSPMQAVGIVVAVASIPLIAG
ncbi:MAG TPA: DMT family transporter [bacterium]|nr:DMT family transporter [bacterium]